MDPREQLDSVLPAVKELVAQIQPWQCSDPTPCSQFAVRDVVDHMIVLGGSFAYSFRGLEPVDVSVPAVSGWIPVNEFDEAMDSLLAAVHSTGAMERTVVTPMGEMPGADFARFVAFDGLVHGWDLASATGLTFELPETVVAAVDQFARTAVTDEMRDGDTFKQPTTPPAGATAIEQLAAFSGRVV